MIKSIFFLALLALCWVMVQPEGSGKAATLPHSPALEDNQVPPTLSTKDLMLAARQYHQEAQLQPQNIKKAILYAQAAENKLLVQSQNKPTLEILNIRRFIDDCQRDRKQTLERLSAEWQRRQRMGDPQAAERVLHEIIGIGDPDSESVSDARYHLYHSKR